MNEIAILMHRIVRDVDRAGDRMLRAEFGVSYSRMLVLLALDVEGPMSQQALAEWVGSTGPAIAGLMREITGEGLAVVAPDPRNRRRNVVRLTDRGTGVVRAARGLLDRRFTDLLEAAGIDAEALAESLRRLHMSIREKGAGS